MTRPVSIVHDWLVFQEFRISSSQLHGAVDEFERRGFSFAFASNHDLSLRYRCLLSTRVSCRLLKPRRRGAISGFVFAHLAQYVVLLSTLRSSLQHLT